MENEIFKNEQLQNLNSKEISENSCEKKTKKCCPNLNLIFNIITLAGVIILFILYFSNKSKPSGNISNKTSMKIGFVNSDSVMDNYEMVKTMKTKLGAKQKEAEDNFAEQQKTFENQVADYQNKMKANTLSIEQAKNTEKRLMDKQQTLLDLKDKLSQTLAEEEMQMNIILQDSIMNFLKRYNKKNNFDYVLGFSKGSGILFANDSLEITKDVIKGLNNEYK